MRVFLGLLFFSIAMGFSQWVDATQWIDADVCVYGGTSGGVIAAVQAAQMGKKVALVVVNNHLGGMTSGGLGQTDLGSLGTGYIQGMTREFYTRVGQKYGTGATYTFEPHVAEAVFNDMVQQAGVQVYTNQYLVSVITQADNSIASVTMNNSNVFRARMFIDASYEGDLMAKAGVSYTVGRESSSQYGESLNGARTPNTSDHQFGSISINPYIVSNNPASGLLPLIETNSAPTAGSADQRVQACNFRMCLTQNATNKIPITAPTNYSAAQYELLARYIQALIAQGSTPTLANFMGIYVMPNGKTDINNNGPVSTDFIGQSDSYLEADAAMRAQLWQSNKNYLQGFFYFLETDPRVPASLSSAMQAYGLCRDEFTDNGGWPCQLYVREARRMVSDYVLTQSNCVGLVTVPDSIGLAAYAMDSHNCERIVVNGSVENEGDTYSVGGISSFWPIPYRAIVPKTGQCPNLLVPWCISASHIAFGSFRMEPVFMIVSQSAGTAACMAIDANVPVQQLDYGKLRLQLLANQQALGSSVVTNSGIVQDNADPTGVTITGQWPSSTSIAGYYGTNYITDNNTNKGTKSVRFTPAIPSTGSYQVYLWWTADYNRATNVPVDVISAAGTNTIIINQTQNGQQWSYIGTFNFTAGTSNSVLIRTTGTSGYVIADAARFVPAAQASSGVDIISTCGQAAKWQTLPGWFTLVRAGSTNSPLTINYTVGGTASNGVDYLPLNNSVTIPAGSAASTVTVIPIANGLIEGNRTVVLTLNSSTNYSFDAYTNATITIQDTPLAQWALAHFTSAQLTNAAISGDNADPNQDGLPNLGDYALGLDPLAANNSGLPIFSIQNGFFTLAYLRADGAVDVTSSVEMSTNLLNWNCGSNHVSDSAINDDGTNQTRIAQALLPTASQPMCFFRFKFARKQSP
ncbi:MAG TPA: FAD-dependent oxidoreductase [Verrucomicrobiae bacterium]|nr:FAD-dependent oxidoreductase [Verrucomicrobiae bacterium]